MTESKKATKMPDEPTYKRLERVGEQLYEELDQPGSHHGVLSEIKECFEGAISDAEALKRLTSTTSGPE